MSSLDNPIIREAIRALKDALLEPEELTRLVSKEQQNQAIAELWNLNWSMSEIAAELRMNRATVSSRLRQMGVR